VRDNRIMVRPFSISSITAQVTVFRGPLVEEVHQHLSPWISQVSILSVSAEVANPCENFNVWKVQDMVT